MKDRKCSRKFPKALRDTTRMIEDSYPEYARPDNGRKVDIRGMYADNGFVVPYNPYLSKRYTSHINVEFVGSILCYKYFYKYCYKGHDAASLQQKTAQCTTMR